MAIPSLLSLFSQSHLRTEALNRAVTQGLLSFLTMMVYQSQLAGLVEFLGLPEAANDCLDSTEGGRGKRRRRASTRDLGDVLVGEQRVVDKRLPDLVEAVIGEAFEASLKLPLRERGKLCRGGARPRRSVSQRRQPFAGANRAHLVDRLLSGALSTELFLSSLGPRRAKEGREGVSTNTNRFSALESSDGDYDDCVDGEKDQVYDVLRADDDGERDGGGGESGGTSRGPISRKDTSTLTVVADVGLKDNADDDPAAAAAGAAARPDSGGGLGLGGRGFGSPDRNVAIVTATPTTTVHAAGAAAAAREAVLRSYGAALIRFRVSVFLYCSTLPPIPSPPSAAAAAAATGGQEEKEVEDAGDPSALTMRRQKVLCLKNLAAVAARLRQTLEDHHHHADQTLMQIHQQMMHASDGGAPAASLLAAAKGLSAKNCVRAAVGCSFLCEDKWSGSGALSARVAAMLLANSGERDDESLAFCPCCYLGHGSPPTPESPPRAGERRRDSGGEQGSGREPGAVDEVAACGATGVKAAFARDPWPEEDLPRATAQAARIFSPDESEYSREMVWKPIDSPPGGGSLTEGSHSGGLCGNERRAALRSRKRKRGALGCSEGSPLPECFDERVQLPPHYAGWANRLPRESRRLLTRLRHHAYVKALEEILHRFLRTAETVAFAAEPSASAAPVVDDTWSALLLRTPHPLLAGLVEPAELALVGAKRVVLPMPNPLYRRVLHDLCRIHGFHSRGGFVVAAGEGGGKTAAGRQEAAIEYRTVEVTRGLCGGEIDCGEEMEPRGDRDVRSMVPIETLLGGRL